MAKDIRKIVEKGYDEGDYQKFFRLNKNLNEMEQRFLDKLLQLIPKNANILDLGSGIGIPYDKYLVKPGCEITGIDISQKHINIARKNVPQAKYIKGDLSNIDFESGSFDAVVSLYAIFHIPREEHKHLFEKIYIILKEKGPILVTMGMNGMLMAVEEWIGSEMAWSSYSIEENKKLIQEAGFRLLHVEEEHHYLEHHLWILAQKK